MGEESNKVEVHIGGEIYKLSSSENTSYIKTVAQYIDKKFSEINSLKSASSINQKTLWLLLALNIADEFFKTKESNEALENLLSDKKSELEKHHMELATAQVENIMLKEMIEKLNLEIRRLKSDLDEFLSE